VPRVASAPLTASPTSLAMAPTRGLSSPEAPDAAQDGREIALLAQVLDLEGIEGCRIGDGRDLLQGACLQASQICAQVSKSTLPFLTLSRARPNSCCRESRTSTSRAPFGNACILTDVDESRARVNTRPSPALRVARQPWPQRRCGESRRVADAMSARILRSRSILAVLSASMNLPYVCRSGERRR